MQQPRELAVKWRRNGLVLTGRYEIDGAKLRTDSAIIRDDVPGAKVFALDSMVEFLTGCECRNCRRIDQ